ncbi:MAG: DMT family transporter [Dermatophilus congolensis]|nr:DMT family transporter [Dermatophilus congolensis]
MPTAVLALSARARANLLILLTSAIWGFAFVSQRVGADHMGPFAFNGVRFALGAVSLVPVIMWLDKRNGTTRSRQIEATRAALGPGILAGLVLFTAATLQQIGLITSTAGEAAFISGLYMVIVPLLGLWLGMRPTWHTWAGVGLAAAGLYLLSVTGRLTIAPGDALLLAGAVFWAIHILVIDRYAPHHDALRLSLVQFVACAAASLVLAVLTEPDPFGGVGSATVPLLYGGIVSVGVAYTLQVVAQRHVRPADAALIFSTEALFGVIGGALFLAENLGLRGYAGCTLMLAGIVVSQLSPQPDSVTEPGERTPV